MQDFKGTIWTNHALKRLVERGVSQSDAWATWYSPDESNFAANKGAWVYKKKIGSQLIEVVAKQNEKKQWLILSVWNRAL